MNFINNNIDEIDSGNKDEKNIKFKRNNTCKNKLRNKMDNINDTITDNKLKSTITESTKNNFVPVNRKKSNDNLKMSVLKVLTLTFFHPKKKNDRRNTGGALTLPSWFGSSTTEKRKSTSSNSNCRR